MSKTFRFNQRKFRQMRLPWMLLAMAPSFAVDLLFVYRVASCDPVMLDHAGHIMAGHIVGVFACNALLLKSWAVIIYSLLKSYRSQGYVALRSGEVVYRRYMPDFSDSCYDPVAYADYHIGSVARVRIRAGGALVVRGVIPVTYYSEDGEIHHTGVRKKCVIPAYYEHLDIVGGRLRDMMTPEEPDGLRQAAV